MFNRFILVSLSHIHVLPSPLSDCLPEDAATGDQIERTVTLYKSISVLWDCWKYLGQSKYTTQQIYKRGLFVFRHCNLDMLYLEVQ